MRYLLILFLFPIYVFSQNNLPYVVGEYSSFNLTFEGINVGSAELEILSNKVISDINTFHIVGKGRTAPFFDWFFKVRDVYETFLDTSTVLPLKFIRDINEGGYKKKQAYNFNHNDTVVYVKDTIYSIPAHTQDMLSALFFARTFSKDSLEINNSFFVPIFMDEENYLLEITYIGIDKVKTEFGVVNCLVFKPMMQEGRVFQDGEKMKIWISDDDNHLLIKVETEIWAGTIKALISECKNIKYPISIIK